MRLNELKNKLQEVSMTPTSFQQSLQTAKQKDVLIGFEFEVCVPKAEIAKTKKTGKKLETPEEYIQAVFKIIDSADDYLSSWKFDDLFKLKPNREFKVKKSKKSFKDIESAIDEITDLDWNTRVDEEFIKQVLTYNQLLDVKEFIDSFDIDFKKLKKMMKEYYLWKKEFDYEQEGDYDYDYMGAVRVLEGPVTSYFSKPIIFTEYHEMDKDTVNWYIEPDGSLEVTNVGDGAAEVVGPPQMVDVAEETLRKFFVMAKQLNLYTNEKTGLHINMSLPDFNEIDLLKLMMFIGDTYTLQQFNREDSDFAKSTLISLEKTPSNDLQHAYKEFKLPSLKEKTEYLNKIVFHLTGHRNSIARSESGKYLSFRHAGKDYLNDYEKIVNTVGRFARALIISSDKELYKDEYLKKLYKLIYPGVEQEKIKKSSITTGEIANVLRDIKQNGMPVIELNLADPYGWDFDYNEVPWDVDNIKRRYNLRMAQVKNSKPKALQNLISAYPEFYTQDRLSNKKLNAIQVYFYPIDYIGSEAILKFLKYTKNDDDNKYSYFKLARLQLTDKKSRQLIQNISQVLGTLRNPLHKELSSRYVKE